MANVNPSDALLSPAIGYDALQRAKTAAEGAEADAAAARIRARQAVDAERRAHYETKRILHGQLDVKDALKKALKEVAPDHPFVNPMEDNPELLKIAEKSKAEFKGTV